MNTREILLSEENKTEEIEKEFSVVCNIGSGSNKNLMIDICSDYFDFDKKKKQKRNSKKEFSTVDKLRRLGEDFLKSENKKEDENKNSFKSFLQASSFSSKISFSNLFI